MADSDQKMQNIHEYIFYVPSIWNNFFYMRGFEPGLFQNCL